MHSPRPGKCAEPVRATTQEAFAGSGRLLLAAGLGSRHLAALVRSLCKEGRSLSVHSPRRGCCPLGGMGLRVTRVKGRTDWQPERKFNHKHKTPNGQQTGWTGGRVPRSSGVTCDLGSVVQQPGLPFAGTRQIMGRGTHILKIPLSLQT